MVLGIPTSVVVVRLNAGVHMQKYSIYPQSHTRGNHHNTIIVYGAARRRNFSHSSLAALVVRVECDLVSSPASKRNRVLYITHTHTQFSSDLMTVLSFTCPHRIMVVYVECTVHSTYVQSMHHQRESSSHRVCNIESARAPSINAFASDTLDCERILGARTRPQREEPNNQCFRFSVRYFALIRIRVFRCAHVHVFHVRARAPHFFVRTQKGCIYL